MAERADSQAMKLSLQENWAAAAGAWQQAADRYSLLNDRRGEAVALHNLAQAERALNQGAKAHDHLEEAAKLNRTDGRMDEWWRNQIALLQLEASSENGETASNRVQTLLPMVASLRDRSLAGVFRNELGLWQQKQGDLNDAEKSFAAAEEDFKAAKDAIGLATIAVNRAELYGQRKNFTAAIASWKEALAKFEALKNPPGIARSLAGEGRALLMARQDLPQAEDLLRRASRNYRLLQKPQEEQATLELLAECLAAKGKEEEATRIRLQLHKDRKAN